ncbi:hypothetical protein SEUCBS140593_005436 [Sporothrix eucalyptigena]|uniref:Uncharacterized protein n=1 Tax=Sporothrix eucalyptigena TaxID=1812306 RepID=A0ABP0BXD5_9PEZI
MSSISRSIIAAPKAGRAAARLYGQAPAATGGMMAQLPSSSCTCGGSSFSALLLPLQTRRGASRKSGPRSPTVRRNERQQQSSASLGPSPNPPPDLRRGGTIAESVFPNDMTTVIPVLDVAIEGLGSSLTRDECLEVLVNVRQISRDKVQVTEASLLRDYNITPYKMHTVATLLYFAISNMPGGSQWTALTASMMHYAATVAGAPGRVYMPSVLSIVHMYGVFMSSESTATVRKSFFFQNAEEQFLNYLAKENKAETNSKVRSDADLVTKANAFTLAGMLAETSGELSRALRWYKAAWEVGWEIKALRGEGPREDAATLISETKNIIPRKPRWDWEQRCLESLGKLQMDEVLAAGKPTPSAAQNEEDARSNDALLALWTAGLALGSGDAGMYLVTKGLTPGLSPRKEENDVVDSLLQRAVMRGTPGAVELVAKREADKVQLIEDKDEAAFQGLLAKEWQLMADASDATRTAP